MFFLYIYIYVIVFVFLDYRFSKSKNKNILYFLLIPRMLLFPSFSIFKAFFWLMPSQWDATICDSCKKYQKMILLLLKKNRFNGFGRFPYHNEPQNVNKKQIHAITLEGLVPLGSSTNKIKPRKKETETTQRVSHRCTQLLNCSRHCGK